MWELDRYGLERRIEWHVDVNAGTARLAEAIAGLDDFVLPLAPMLGCIGVAPVGSQAISTATSGPYGGASWAVRRPRAG